MATSSNSHYAMDRMEAVHREDIRSVLSNHCSGSQNTAIGLTGDPVPPMTFSGLMLIINS